VAYPSGSGSERLMRGTIHAQGSTETAFKFDGTHSATGTNSGTGYTVATNHIITLLNFQVCDNSGSSTTFRFHLVSGGNDFYLLTDQILPANSTFAWNEKIVLHPTDSVKINQTGGGTNFDVYYSYIDQDWT
tara:strand:- start:220 stop:615 length:396 start_codon:yes stop_codon:yes gene_type:complete